MPVEFKKRYKLKDGRIVSLYRHDRKMRTKEQTYLLLRDEKGKTVSKLGFEIMGNLGSFHTRAKTRRDFRGRGCFKTLLRLALKDMKKRGVKEVITIFLPSIGKEELVREVLEEHGFELRRRRHSIFRYKRPAKAKTEKDSSGGGERVKIVCIGDFHIPSRRSKIPSWIKKKIQEEKPEKIVCTGDFTDEKTFREVQKMGEVIAVKGNMDWIELPQQAVLELESLRIGVIHGSGIVPRGDLKQLASYARRMRANVLVHGHTHHLDIKEKDGVLYVNPGSATGSYGGSSAEGPETFLILEIEGKRVKVKKFINGEETEELYEL